MEYECTVALTDSKVPQYSTSSLCAGLTCDDECTYDCTWITTQIMQRRFKKVAVFILTFFTCQLWHELVMLKQHVDPDMPLGIPSFLTS
jgi:hypothetical protein